MKSTAKKSSPIFEKEDGYYKIVWIDKFKSTVKRCDQRQIDLAHLRGMLTDEMHEIATVWWYLSYQAQINPNVTSQLGRIGSFSGGGKGKTYSNKQVEARRCLKKVHKFVLENFDEITFNLLEGFIVYDCSLREFSEISGISNRKGLSVKLKDCLNKLYEHQYLFSH